MGDARLIEEWTPKMLQEREIITELRADDYPENIIDEILPGLYLGNFETVRHPSSLCEKSITHVLCCCYKEEGRREKACIEAGLVYRGIPTDDLDDYDMSQWFESSADFIEEAIESGGTILVHCSAGVSRAATIVTAFLMLKRHKTVDKALQFVKSKRPICPNDGFLKQLCLLNEKLRTRGRFHTDLV